jgi:hypothetical protein
MPFVRAGRHGLTGVLGVDIHPCVQSVNISQFGRTYANCGGLTD